MTPVLPRNAVYIAARQAHQACSKLLGQLRRPPFVPRHSHGQRDFVEFMTQACSALMDTLEDIGHKVGQPDENVDMTLIGNSLDQCHDIMTDVAMLQHFATDLAQLGVTDMPSPLILWIQKTFEFLSGNDKSLLIARTEEENFIVLLEGIGPRLKVAYDDLREAGTWPIAQFPELRPLGLFDTMILYHEMMHPVFVERDVFGNAVDRSDVSEISQTVESEAERIAALLRDPATIGLAEANLPSIEDFTEFVKTQVNEIIRRWSAELFCDLAATAVTGPCSLIGMILFRYDLPAQYAPGESQSLNNTHPPLAYRQHLLYNLLAEELGWSKYLDRLSFLDKWLKCVAPEENIFTESEADSPKTKAIKCAAQIVVEHYLPGLRIEAVKAAQELPFPFAASPGGTDTLRSNAVQRLKEGVVPFEYLPGRDMVAPLDILNVAASFLLSGEIEQAWADYGNDGKRVHQRAVCADKLYDLVLKAVEDSLMVWAYLEGAHECSDKG